jgi:CheY-like chemotaxis protein/anti-sigma regulatory factor (Ser/Thr protein kinase)
VLTQPRWRDQALAHGAPIRVETQLLDVPPVAVVEAEIRELLTNLIFNAVDAMPDGGVITISTLPEGDWVTLEVADSGTGMSAEVRRRCLEPFFSTKGERGTGLGLAMVYGIIKRHGGSLDIESEPGHGTTFIMRFPVHARQAAGPSVREAAPVGRVLQVLLVDDDREARNVIQAYLTSDGHAVRTAADGREAWEEFQRGRFDLVITDRAMPRMSGALLAVAIKQAAPATPIIMLSGFADLHGGSGGSLTDADMELTKPITLAALREAVARSVADRDPSPAGPRAR